MNSICIFSKDDKSYGSSVIINHLRSVAESKGLRVYVCSDISLVEPHDLVVAHGLWASYKLVKEKREFCKNAFLVDSLVLSMSSELKYFTKNRFISFRNFVIYLLRWIKYTFQEYIIFKNFENIILVSVRDKQYYENSLLFRHYSNKIIVIPNGIDIPTINFSCRQDKGRNSIILGCLSAWNDTVYYTLMIFLKNIWAEAIKLNPNMVLKVAGRGLTEKYIKNIKKFTNIEIVGELSNLGDFYSSIDISLITLCKEAGILNKVLEAFSYKVPVLGMKPNFLAFENIPDCYYEYWDSKSFLESVDSISNDHAKVINKTNLAYDYIKKYNNWEVNYSDLLSNLEFNK